MGWARGCPGQPASRTAVATLRPAGGGGVLFTVTVQAVLTLNSYALTWPKSSHWERQGPCPRGQGQVGGYRGRNVLQGPCAACHRGPGPSSPCPQAWAAQRQNSIFRLLNKAPLFSHHDKYSSHRPGLTLPASLSAQPRLCPSGPEHLSPAPQPSWAGSQPAGGHRSRESAPRAGTSVGKGVAE